MLYALEILALCIALGTAIGMLYRVNEPYKRKPRHSAW